MVSANGAWPRQAEGWIADLKMIRQNKDGRPIFSETTWRKLLETGKKLEDLGYVELSHKQNLFSRKVDPGYIYADLRGTDEVPIWDGPVPLLYFFAARGKSVPEEDERTILKDEFKRLKEGGCEPRFSFYATSEPEGLFFSDYEVSEL